MSIYTENLLQNMFDRLTTFCMCLIQYSLSFYGCHWFMSVVLYCFVNLITIPYIVELFHIFYIGAFYTQLYCMFLSLLKAVGWLSIV